MRVCVCACTCSTPEVGSPPCSRSPPAAASWFTARAVSVSRGPSPPRAVLCPSSAHLRPPGPEWTISEAGVGRRGTHWPERNRAESKVTPPRAQRAILRFVKTTDHVIPRAALHISRWSPCSPVRGDSPFLVCEAIPPPPTVWTGVASANRSGSPGAGCSRRSAEACKSFTSLSSCGYGSEDRGVPCRWLVPRTWPAGL